MESFLVQLGKLQIRRPASVVILMLLTLLPAGWAASRLTLRTAFSELLPDSKPSVIEMRRVQSRLSGTSTLTVVAEASGPEPLKRFVDAASPKIAALGPEFVGGIDDGPRRLHAFFEEHKHLYASLEDLRQLRDDVVEAYDAQVAHATGMDLGLDDEEPQKVSVDDIIGKLQKKADEAKRSSPGMDGYYIGEDGKLAALLVRTPFGTGDARAFELQRRIEAIIAEVNPKQWDPSFRFGFTGNLLTSAEEQHAITTDLTHVGMWGVAFILGVVFLFFLQVRTLIAMAITIGVGCVWAFGLASFTVGYLNTATGFLVSIIVGNGVNFGIMFMARYSEARREERLPVGEAILVAHRGTWKGTLSAAGAAMIAYGSLSITDFRGFKHFGVIGGAGMLLCWVATYLILPALLVLFEKWIPARYGAGDLEARFAAMYGRPFAFLATRIPRGIAAVALVTGVLGVALGARYFLSDPMQYNLRKIGNDDTGPTPTKKLSQRVDKIVGRLGQDGRAILVDRLDQIEPLVTELERRRDAAPAGDKPFSKIVTVHSLLPKEQPAKIELLQEIKTRIDKARRRGMISDADWTRLAPHVPAELRPLGIEDLPANLVRPFSERDGARGRVVYIVPTEKKSVYDAHYLMKWADSFREVRLPNGEVIRGSGDPVIFSDMLKAIGEEAPKAILLSLFGTIAVILLTFRGSRAAWMTFATLALGLSWLAAFLFADHVKLNFLNFVALPITIGVGADYAINIMARREKGLGTGESVERVVVETGGAVILCSLTTVLGYLALLLSINQAVRSFGLVAAMGEVTTLMSAVLVLPSFLEARARRRRE